MRKSTMQESSRILHIRLLGDFRLTYGDDEITSIDTPRLQSLLAYLLLHRNAPQSRHRLAFLFWSDSPDDQALTNLRNLLYHLRHKLPDADRFLDVDRNTLQWRTDVPFELDVARFETELAQADQEPNQMAALERAVEAYGGDLLPSCYEDWIQDDRERLRQAFAGALERLIQLLEDQQQYAPAIHLAQRLVRHDPLRETAYHRLMELLALAGDRPAALRVYHKCATTLKQELDVEPGPATRALYGRLLASDGAPSPVTPQPKTAATPRLVGRQAPWAKLEHAWQRAQTGHPHLVAISSEAGLGKTRLAEELVRYVEHQGMIAATARCYAAEGELAYATAAAWLRDLPLPQLDPVWQAEIARILPDQLLDPTATRPPGPPTEPWERHRFFEALARAVLGCRQPLLLMVDALQWCDRGTLEWLHYLLRFDPRAQLLVAGSYRPGEIEADHPLTALLHALRADGQLVEIELAPLDEEETHELAVSVAGYEPGPELTECLYHETEGNPLFIVETVRAGLPDGVERLPSGDMVCVPRPLPSRMQEALTARVAQLSPVARELAELSATIGREFTFTVLGHATETGEDVLVRALDELWQRRIIREQGHDAYDFSHDKLREVICDELSTARQRLLHRRVAHALERAHAGNLDPVAARVAVHYERSGHPRQAIEYYRRAADIALRTENKEDAARYRQRAAALSVEVQTKGSSND